MILVSGREVAALKSAKGKYRVATTDKLLCPARRKYKYTTTWSSVNNSVLNTIININPLGGWGRLEETDSEEPEIFLLLWATQRLRLRLRETLRFHSSLNIAEVAAVERRW